jgi:hypothetical protein
MHIPERQATARGGRRATERRTMRRSLAVGALAVALLFSATAPSLAGTAGAATHLRSHPALFDKTRFALHLGLAYFAFHHFVYNRYRQGAFKSGAPHRTSTIIKAGVALVFTAHELKVAYDIARKSNSGVLHALIKPLQGLVGTSQRVGDRLRGGQFNDAEVKNVINGANSFSSQATKNGISIKDIKVFVPGQT